MADRNTVKQKVWCKQKWGVFLGIVLCGALLFGGVVIAQGTSPGSNPPAAPGKAQPTSPIPPFPAGPGNIFGGQVVKPAPVTNNPSRLQIDPEKYKKLESQGFTAEDIYTALNLQNQTGKPLEETLAFKKNTGKSWPEVLRELGQGMTITQERQPLALETRNLTPEEIRAFVNEGYSSEDILAAGEITYVYGSDPRELLLRRSQGETWANIDKDEGAKWRARQEAFVKEVQANPAAGLFFGKEKSTTTRSGLTRDEIASLNKLGYSIDDIVQADSMAYSLGLDLRAIAAQKPKEMSLVEAVWDAEQKRPIEERLARAKQQPKPDRQTELVILSKATGRSVQELIDSRVLENYWINGLTDTQSRLTREELEALAEKGYTAEEIIQADGWAYSLGLDIRQIVAKKRADQSLLAAVREADMARPLAERIAAIERQAKPDEATMKRILSQDPKGLPKNPPPGPAYVYDDYALAESWGITDRDFVKQVLDRGFKIGEVYQIVQIARDTGKSPQEVMVLKTETNTWVDVAQTLRPGKNPPPPRPQAPPAGSELRPPSVLPRGGDR